MLLSGGEVGLCAEMREPNIESTHRAIPSAFVGAP